MAILRFDDIIEQLPVDPQYKAKFVEAYPALHDYVTKNFRNTRRFKQNTLNKLNYMLFVLYSDNVIMYNWKDVVQAEEFSYEESRSEVSSVITPNFLDVEDVDWSCLSVADADARPVESVPLKSSRPALKSEDDGSSERSKVGTFEVKHTGEGPKTVSSGTSSDFKLKKAPTASSKSFESSAKAPEILEEDLEPVSVQTEEFKPTPKEDLFIVTPKYPRVANFHYRYGNVHVSLPQVPTKQCEVSCTTDVNNMTSKQLLDLFPNRFVRTRSPLMYESKDGVTLDPDFGLLVPVDGFTDAEVRDCIIRYPHIFKLKRVAPDGSLISFYNHIEIDGELIDTLEAWSFLPEAKALDFDSMETRQEQVEFMKEYAIRRYLLERDVKGIKHKYPVVGELPEFVTLFMPADMYAKEGFKDPVELARTCVKARVSYLASRNPRIGNDVTVKDCVFDSYCTRTLCDRACPRWAQMDYLMMRNGLTSKSRPFMMKMSSLQKYVDLFEESEGSTVVVECNDPVKVAEALSYVAVCNSWNGSAMRVKAYHLLYSSYIQETQASWNGKKSDDLEYKEIWSRSSNVLVVSDLDYVNFKDFQSQTLLQLMQDREREGKTTFVVVPKLGSLAGSGKMYVLLTSKLRKLSRFLD